MQQSIPSYQQRDAHWMHQALLEAKKAAALGEIPVGAVIVRDEQVIARAHNRRELDQDAMAHAEVLCIQQACRVLNSWRLSGCTLYVTLEPCPMCSGAIINSRLDRVVYGAKDDKAGCAGSVADLFVMPFNHTPVIRSASWKRNVPRYSANFLKLSVKSRKILSKTKA